VTSNVTQGHRECRYFIVRTALPIYSNKFSILHRLRYISTFIVYKHDCLWP